MFPPRYVKLGETALKRQGQVYWRDAGRWGVKWKIINEILVAWKELYEWRGYRAYQLDMFDYVHMKPLIEITEEEYLDNNGQYGYPVSEAEAEEEGL